MIVGQRILDSQLVTGGSRENLKHSTFDLTIGRIVPIGKNVAAKKKQISIERACFLEPREMVWILSNEQFNMPRNITGLATLRTTYTKDGILALNVGIIDPFFRGPISTALINFSDRPRRIQLGDKFFRVLFFEHDDVTEFHRADESVAHADYIRELDTKSYADFAPSFLNIPSFDDDYYTNKFWSIVGKGIWDNKLKLSPLFAILAILVWFLFEHGFWNFLSAKLDLIGEVIKHFHVF